MEPSSRCEPRWPPYPVSHHHHHCRHHPIVLHAHHHHTELCPVHHHHHHHSISCPLHHHHHNHLTTCHSHVSPSLAPLPLQNHLNMKSTNESHHSANPALQEQEYEQVVEVEEEDEDEDDEPIFVLTDEWKEFFAKSEAKRRLEKKQAKEKRKN